MKHIAFKLIIVASIILMCISPVLAKGQSITVTDPRFIVPIPVSIIPMHHHENIHKPAPLNTSQYTYADKLYSDNIFESTMQLLKLMPLSDDISVIIDNEFVAVIPENSKFKDIKVHNACLKYQYGTDTWFKCEEKLK